MSFQWEMRRIASRKANVEHFLANSAPLRGSSFQGVFWIRGVGVPCCICRSQGQPPSRQLRRGALQRLPREIATLHQVRPREAGRLGLSRGGGGGGVFLFELHQRVLTNLRNFGNTNEGNLRIPRDANPLPKAARHPLPKAARHRNCRTFLQM